MKKSKKSKKRLFGKIPYLSLIGILVGLIGGYLYYSQIGCESGTCTITSNPYLSMGWGGAMGYLLFDMFQRKDNNKESDTD